MKRVALLLGVFSFVLGAILFAAHTANASHSWGGYHWARTANTFKLRLGTNVSSIWGASLVTASGDWSQSTVLDTTIVPGSTNPKNCRPTSGRVEVCNSSYGNNGWLGIAQIWISGNHIAQGSVKMNDTYFNMAFYNKPAWRQFVTCQEIAHTLGLDHQDENFTNPNLGTCMDYTNDPSTNQHPNAHDYQQLGTIYSHLDSYNSYSNVSPAGSSGQGNSNVDHPSEWGRIKRFSRDGRPSLFERDLGGGNRVQTFVIWAR